MTGDLSAPASNGCHIFNGCGFPAPGLQDFNWKPFFTIGSFGFTKPMLLAILAALVVIVFFWAAFRKPKLVPRGVQNLGEMAILGVRDQILRPSLGRKGDSYLPFLVSLFFFIYIMNVMELIPILQFPVTSRIGFVWPMVFIVYFLYLYLGVKHQGAWGYLRNMIPPGVPWPIYVAGDASGGAAEQLQAAEAVPSVSLRSTRVGFALPSVSLRSTRVGFAQRARSERS